MKHRPHIGISCILLIGLWFVIGMARAQESPSPTPSLESSATDTFTPSATSTATLTITPTTTPTLTVSPTPSPTLTPVPTASPEQTLFPTPPPEETVFPTPVLPEETESPSSVAPEQTVSPTPIPPEQTASPTALPPEQTPDATGPEVTALPQPPTEVTSEAISSTAAPTETPVASNCPLDVDGNGTVDAGDLTMLYALQRETGVGADYNGDGEINVLDIQWAIANSASLCPNS